MNQSEIRQLLPVVFQRTIRPGNPLSALLEIMEALQEPSVRLLEQLNATFDPRRTPDRFVPFLACWVDLERLFQKTSDAVASSSDRSPISSGLGRLRELTASAAYLSKWRGTEKGLQLFLEIATGERGFQIDDEVPNGGRPRPFYFRVVAPAAAKVHEALVQRIIEQEKPAYVTFDLLFAPA